MHFIYSKGTGFSLEKALATEWLETNGLGGYSSSNAVNCNTRKYHGLLVSKISGLPDKYVLLNKVEDVFIDGACEKNLSAHFYPGVLQGDNFDNLIDFKVTTHPIWRFKFSDTILTKEVLMLNEENTVLLKYGVSNVGKCQISFRPLFSCRNFHSLQHENSFLEKDVGYLADGFSFAPYQGLPKVFLQVNAKFNFLSQPFWYRNFIYTKERERGYDYAEDLFSPGVIVFDFSDKCEVIVACGIARQKDSLSTKWQQELSRRPNDTPSKNTSEFQEHLHKIGQSFITTELTDKKPQAIVAGYHWFLEWGRDAMIALPGLTLYSGRQDICLAILKTFAFHESAGLIPNYFGVTQASDAFNTVDASLWFAWAVQQYYLKTKRLQEITTYFWTTLKSIFQHYRQGTLYDIKMQDNGLLYAGNREVNLTWMDAVVDGKPVTPRYGYQVEVNALWFNLLGFMAELAQAMKDPMASELKQLLTLTQNSFRETFWCEEKAYLYDFVNAEEKNSRLRPNQIFAISLPYSPLLAQMAVSIVAKVKEHLLTPYGLRTLAPSELGYVGCYRGSQSERDRAYHNGTVWPWLLGHFVEALLKVTSDKRKVMAIVEPCLKALQDHLAEYGVGSISEIFSGDYPHEPNGCISQAWSVAEILRLTYLVQG